MKTKMSLLVLLFVSISTYGAVVNDGMLVDDTCYSISGGDYDSHAACMSLATTTTLPTAFIDSKDVSVDDEEVMAKLIEERNMKVEKAEVTKTVADYFGVETFIIQQIVIDLYNTNTEVNLIAIQEMIQES